MNKKTFLFFFITLVIFQITAQEQNKCNYTINSWYWKFDGEDVGNLRNVTIHDPVVAANHPLNNIGNNPKLYVKAGDVICLDASVPYRFLTWENIKGDATNPVLIKNVGGQVVIRSLVASYGWLFKNSQNFKILGNGDPNYKYGFKVTTHKNSFIQFVSKTSDFEIAHVEVAGDHANGTHPTESGFAGIMAKSQPICWDDENGGSTDAGNFEMKNVYIHDNYIHDVAGEGMYVGYGKSQGVLLNSSTGNKSSKINYPHNVSNLYIYNNIVENVGWDGIQVKNAHQNANVYNNVIKNYANLNIGAHDEGLFVGDGSEANIYGNWVEGGNIESNGMQINAFGNTKIYNNVILGAGFNGLYLNNQSTQFANKAGTFEIYNNTVEGGTGSAIISHTPQNVIIKNNIGFGYGAYHGIKNPTIGTAEANLIAKEVADVGFVDFQNGDVRLNDGISAINSGLSHDFDEYDFTGNIRDTNVDLGAIENGSLMNNTNVNIDFTSPVSDNISISSEQSIPIKVSLTDLNNKVKSVEYLLNNNVVGSVLLPNKLEHLIDFKNLILGVNTFNVKVTLYGGVSFNSSAITINNNFILSVTSEDHIVSQLKYYYNAENEELITDKANNIDVKAIEIYNLLGKKIQSWKNINNKNKTIKMKVNNLKPGVYIVKIKTDKSVFSKKMFF